ncbi:MAG: SDR family NAD(P)-dependent oxidoreductase [Anaerolineales bacterium]|nr:SDR family NAD(P)-dependent oxidoreductase [Anaerolineales bacterium]
MMKWKTAITTLGLGMAGYKALQHLSPNEADLAGQVVLITGASRGLGYLLAHEFAAAGCRLVICARHPQPLFEVEGELRRQGADVLAVPCDVADQAQVQHLVDEATRHYGRIDIVVNNAGIIQAGPVEAMTLADFEQALDVMYWGILYTTWAVLPQMRRRGHGRIVTVTSIGGKVSVPHLLPYNSAKFAAIGLSQGLRAELAGDGIRVTTIVPGLMRTGSHLQAQFKGNHAQEFTWFSLGASLPLVSMDARRAARQIVQATRRGDTERVLSIPAQLLARWHGLFPGLTTEMLTLVNALLLPEATAGKTAVRTGEAVQAELAPWHARLLGLLTILGQRAARRNHQLNHASTTQAEARSTSTW